MPVLVCHDEVVVECDADKAQKEWLVRAMLSCMAAVVNAVEPHILIEVEASASWRVEPSRKPDSLL